MLDTMYHVMNMNKKITNFLNPSQTPVDTCDLMFKKNSWPATSRSKTKILSFQDLLLIKYMSRTTKLSRALEEPNIYQTKLMNLV